MKKIYLFACVSALVFSCSNDDGSPSMEGETLEPIIESISTANATAGDIITINGKNFDANETYIVKFNEVEGIVTEIQPTFLKAQVPQEATSGDITLTVNGKTTTVGAIEITSTPPISTTATRLFGYIAYDKIVELNTETGEEIATLANTGQDYLGDVVFSESTNEIIGQISTSNGMTNSYTFSRINAETGEITSNAYTGYEHLIVTDTGKLFAYVAYDKIVELNIETGEEIKTLVTIGQDYLSDVVFSESTNEIIGQLPSQNSMNGKVLYKVNISTGAVSETEITGYEHLIVSDAGKLFAYVAYDKIVELNIETGEEIKTLVTIGQDYLSDVVFSENTNEIIGQLPSQNSMNGKVLYTVNVTTGESTQKEFTGYEHILIKNNN